MPLDVLGCTRVTLAVATSSFLPRKGWVNFVGAAVIGIDPCNYYHERGIPSKRSSSNCADYVPALCTHRPSLVPIEWSGEDLGLVILASRKGGGSLGVCSNLTI